ncbi:MAG TPA: HAMP domain-containing histidine kinase, partial [Candidatus Wirthbacteria bacterium]|nr:HAMP domain-containing histidine kinase [Candidatus Wirthbacteria bacterium]
MSIYQQVKSYLGFLRSNKQIVYALALIVIVPLILAGNTYYVVNETGKNMDYQLRLEAEMVGTLVASFSSPILDNQAELQNRIEIIKNQALQDYVSRIDIMVPHQEQFLVMASTDLWRVGNYVPEWQYAYAWHQNEALATYSHLDDLESEDHVWKVTSIIRDEGQKRIGLVDVSISTRHIDQKTQDILIRSLVVLVFSILVVLLLVANNVRLFEYALLFHKMKEVDGMKDDFISTASHELKTPVTAARGFLSLIQQEGDQLDQQIKDDIDKSVGCLDRLSELVSDLLDVSRIEQQRIKLRLEMVDAKEVIEDIVEQMQDAAEEKGLFMIFQPLLEETPLIEVDRSKLRQIVWNLVSNAIKY